MPSSAVPTSTIVRWVELERLRIADLLAGLSDDDWTRQSLCPQWTIHQLAAHVTTSVGDTLIGTLRGLIASRGDWNAMTAQTAIDIAATTTPAAIIARIRETAASPKRAPGAAPIDPLIDMLVHSQDISIPLAIEWHLPTEPAVAALNHVVRSRFYPARKAFRGLRVLADDADFSIGDDDGDEVRAPIAALLLVATGRPAGLADARGPGVDQLSRILTG